MKLSIGIPSLLTIIFVILRLCNVIDWSWWWVFSPLWIMAGLILLMLVVGYFIGRWLD